MVNTSRILTVSYGTFSCTLEGFDDPFSTMTSIAEYFRDLAADDRYFGAEPPTPDAEMLHRIAEREIHKRVEARVSENGVVLRQTADDEIDTRPAALLADTATEDAAREAALAEDARKAAEEEAARIAAEEAVRIAAEEEAARIAAEEEAAREAAEAEAARRAEDVRRAAEQEAARRAKAAQAAPVAGSAAEKLMRIRALVDTANVAPGDYVEDQHAEEYFADNTVAFDQMLEDALADDADDDAEAPELARVDDDETAISAVLGSLASHPAAMEEDEAAIEDEDEDTDGIGSLIAAWDEDEDEIEYTESLLTVVEDETFEQSAEAPAEAAPAAPEEPAAPRRPVARVIKVRRLAVPPHPAEEDAAEEEPEQDETFQVPGVSTLSDEEEAELAAELAEVARDAEIARFGEPDEKRAYDDNEDGDDVELADAIAEAEETAETPLRDPLSIEPEEEPADRIAPRPASLRTAFDDQAIADTDGALDRILEKTNSQLESGEASRRHSAIQHLKRAVLATRADRDAAEPAAEEDDVQNAYRADLARVVRPRRPAGGTADGGKRPTRRLAPLVLVSEQRIDAPESPAGSEPARHVTPVRPRRVSKSNLAVARNMDDDAEEDAIARAVATAGFAPAAQVALDETETDDDFDGAAQIENSPTMVAGFKAYLAEHRASSHDELVEAGVAYMTQEVGRANVARTELISLVLNAVPELSREEALRAFGRQVKAEHLRRIKRGIFTLTEKSRFFDTDL